MGGNAFAQPSHDGPGLHCPRMPLNVYLFQRDKFSVVLQQLFDKVLIPFEAPGKQDFGDIDFLVAGPRASGDKPDDSSDQPALPTKLCLPIAQLKIVLGATRHLTNSPVTCSFAVPYTLPDKEVESGDIDDFQKSFIQIDIDLAPNVEQAEWRLLTHSYGDLSQIFGMSLSSLSLTFMPQGFYARIPEMELASLGNPAISKDSTLLYLSRDPRAVLRFLGLDPDIYLRGFDNENDMFRWITSGTLFDRLYFIDRRENGKHRSLGQRTRESHRRQKRPLYRRFVEEWLPENSSAGARDERFKRDLVFADAVKYFGVSKELNTKLTDFRSDEEEQAFWTSIEQMLSLTKVKLRRAVRALRCHVHFEQGNPTIATVGAAGTTLSARDTTLRWTMQGRDAESLRLWVHEHWQEVVELEKNQQRE